MRESQSEAMAASASYFVMSVCLSLTNKAVFSRADFDFPLSVLASQALVTVVLLLLAGEMQIGPLVRFDTRLARKMLPVTLLFVAMLWTSSRALRYCSVPVVTIFKNLSVVAITVYERIVYSDRSSVGVLLSLLCMLAGSVVAAAGDLEFSSVGYGWMLLNVVCTVCHLAAVRAWLRDEASSTAKTFHNQLYALAIFAAGATAQGELAEFPRRLLGMPPSFQAGFLLSTVLGLLINLSSFWALRVTTGTTYSFVGASNKIPAAILGCAGLLRGPALAWRRHAARGTRTSCAAPRQALSLQLRSHHLWLGGRPLWCVLPRPATSAPSSLLHTAGTASCAGLASGLGFSISKYRLRQAAEKSSEDIASDGTTPPSRGRRSSSGSIELVEAEHGPSRLVAGRERRTGGDFV